MTKQFCDRCQDDITKKRSGHVDAIDNADSNGDGTVTEEWDLCSKCLSSLRIWVTHSFERKGRR